MERLAEADTVVFDKTGTLTLGSPRLIDAERADPAHLALAASMAVHSRHPHSVALAALPPGPSAPSEPFDSVSEQPGLGLEAMRGETVFRLGRADWALDETLDETGEDAAGRDELGTVLSRNGAFVARSDEHT